MVICASVFFFFFFCFFISSSADHICTSIHDSVEWIYFLAAFIEVSALFYLPSPLIFIL